MDKRNTKKKRILIPGLLLLGVLLACWALTYALGLGDVEDALAEEYGGNTPDDASLQIHEFDKTGYLQAVLNPAEPWWFRGNWCTPAPFVISCEMAFMSEVGYGGGERVYFLWLFGHTKQIGSSDHWRRERYK